MNRAIAWFAQNAVAANLLMWFLIVAGMVSFSGLHREEFPEIRPGLIRVEVEYPGGAPEEIEESVCVRIEESLDGADGIEHIRSTALEGSCQVMLELLPSADAGILIGEVKNRIDSIHHLPEEAEKPVVSNVVTHIPVVDIAISGPAEEATLKEVGARLREEILALPGITRVELHFARPYEISIEVSEEALRRFGLTFDEVARVVRQSSLDLPGGQLRTQGGEIRLRTTGQAHVGEEFERLIVIAHADGTGIPLGEIARVVDGFEEVDLSTRIDGDRAVMVRVLRVGREDALDIRDRVEGYLSEGTGWIPDGLRVGIWLDHSLEIRERLRTLLENGLLGLGLVLLVLAVFLRFRLAFWVAAGLPVVFLGALTLFPWLGLSINTITVVSFILALGIVVDDAIVVGENVHSHQQRKRDPLDAAISGTREVYVPVIFGVLTTVAAFAPLILVGGDLGTMFSGVGVGVIGCLFFSIVESQLILPAHLGRVQAASAAVGEVAGGWRRFQEAVSERLDRFVAHVYGPFLERLLLWRYLAVACAVSALMLTAALMASGRVPYEFVVPVEGDHVAAVISMPPGTALHVTRGAVAELEGAARLLRAELEKEHGGEQIVRHVVSSIGAQPFQQSMAVSFGGGSAGADMAEVTLALTPGSTREVGAHEIAGRWRALVGDIPDAKSLVFGSDMLTAGRAIDLQLRGAGIETLRRAAAQVRALLEVQPGVIDLEDTFSSAQREIELTLRPEARPLGLTLHDLARQVRQAFYGQEVQRIQRGSDEVRVMVRYPEGARRSLGDLEELRVRTAAGAEVPLGTVARVAPGRGLAAIHRTDRARVVNVAADVDRSVTTPNRVVAALEARLPAILREFPGVGYRFEGAQEQSAEAGASLLGGFALALLGIYALLAVPLRSYAQPLIIMSVIPFGAIGAMLGHVVLGRQLSFFSLVGMVALAGVVVNASLMLLHFVNSHREQGATAREAIRAAGQARFRPILLTSLTTFVGLLPLILERSIPLQTMIPMAVSLAAGVLISTVFTLLLVPCEYCVVEDLETLLSRRRAARR